MRVEVRLGLSFVIWAAITGTLVVAAGGSVDVFVVLLLIGLVLTRELFGAGAPDAIRSRVGVFIFTGLLAFAVIVVERVRQILNL